VINLGGTGAGTGAGHGHGRGQGQGQGQGRGHGRGHGMGWVFSWAWGEYTLSANLKDDTDTLGELSREHPLALTFRRAMAEPWTGVIRIREGGTHVGSMLLWQGRLAWATSRFVEEDLASTLQTGGAVDERRACEIRSRYPTFGKLRALGGWLEEQGYASRLELRGYLRSFLRRVIRSFLEREELAASSTAHTLEADSEMTFGWDELFLEDPKTGAAIPRPQSKTRPREEPNPFERAPRTAPSEALGDWERPLAPRPRPVETPEPARRAAPRAEQRAAGCDDETQRAMMSWSGASDPWAVLEGRAGAKVVALLSVKGGLGKTTLAINLAVASAELGRRTILIDVDPFFGVDVALDRVQEDHPGLWDFLSG
jgi:hypothetical protein